MNSIDLKQIKISEYIELLKDGKDIEKINLINEALSLSISGASGEFDLQLFQMNKDLLLFLCKYTMAMLEFDQKKMAVYAKRAEDMRKAIDKKKSKAEKSDPYTSFLQWLFTLKKYYGSDIDRGNDLMELVVATESMMKFYKAQDEMIEKQKVK